MKNLFYLNFTESELLRQKCSVKKFIKGIERPAGADDFLTLDCGGHTSVNQLTTKKKAVFFNTTFAVKVRFSRVLFIQSFLLTHQKMYVDFADRYQENVKMLRNINFCTMLILKVKRGGYLVRAAGFVCFLPRWSYRVLFGTIAKVHYAASVAHQLRVLLIFLLKISLKLKADFSIFSSLCRKVCFERVLNKGLVFNRALLSNKLPLKQQFGCGLAPDSERPLRLRFKFKLSPSYFKKKFRNKRRVWRGRARFLLYLKSPLPKKKKRKKVKVVLKAAVEETVGFGVNVEEKVEIEKNSETVVKETAAFMVKVAESVEVGENPSIDSPVAKEPEPNKFSELMDYAC